MFYNKIIEFLKFLKIDKTKNNSIIKEIKNESISPSENYNISEAINEAFDSNSVDNKADINSNQIDQLGNEGEIKKESFLVSFFINNPSSIFLGLIIAIFVGTGIWASFTELDEVIRSSGQIVPASNAKVVQSEFQGKVSTINVSVGDNVKKGNVLLVLDNSDFLTEININKEDYFSSMALISRLEGEASFTSPVFQKELIDTRLDLMNAQIQIFNSRMKKLQDEEKLLKNELERLIYNIEEVKADISSSIEERKFLNEELQILTPLVKKGFEPRLKLIQISQRLAALDSKISKSKVAIPGIKIDIKKITQQLKNLKSDFISKAKEEIVAAKDRFNKSVLKSKQLENRLKGTKIVAPVDGLISKVEITTIGAIVSSGTDLFEIIPSSDELIIEAEVRPEDVAFVRYGQKARISITAYDPSVYGFLDGEVQNIAGNTSEKPDGTKYFSARIITKSKIFDKQKDKQLDIIPGMQASVELQGDKRSVLDYILTPIKKLQREAFTEM
jgi:adhesin transport system membrane fusion protein